MCIRDSSKVKFNKSGERGFFYIGRPSRFNDEKGINLLKEIAQIYPNWRFGCIFPGKIPGWANICNPQALTPELITKKIAPQYDFFINFSRADAQATTVLEAMSWGFPIATTRETGYVNENFTYLTLENMTDNVEALKKMQLMTDSEINAIVDQNLVILKSKYTWEVIKSKFIQQFEKIIYD